MRPSKSVPKRLRPRGRAYRLFSYPDAFRRRKRKDRGGRPPYTGNVEAIIAGVGAIRKLPRASGRFSIQKRNYGSGYWNRPDLVYDALSTSSARKGRGMLRRRQSEGERVSS